MMVIAVNPSQYAVNDFTVYRIGSPRSKNEGPVFNQDYVPEKLSGFSAHEKYIGQATQFTKKRNIYRRQ